MAPVYDEDPDALYRGIPPRVPRVRAISSSDRLLKPTKASLANSRAKVLTGKEKELAEARELARKRRRLRSAKENGRLTVPKSPKFHKAKKVTPRSRADMLTRTSRELLEIDAIRKRIEAQKRKTQKYHDKTTHGVAPGRSDQFSRALTASGGVGVPAVRRTKLTTPVGFAFEIDKRVEARKSVKRKSVAADVEEKQETRKRLKRKSVVVEVEEVEDEENEPPLKQRRKSAAEWREMDNA